MPGSSPGMTISGGFEVVDDMRDRLLGGMSVAIGADFPAGSIIRPFPQVKPHDLLRQFSQCPGGIEPIIQDNHGEMIIHSPFDDR